METINLSTTKKGFVTKDETYSNWEETSKRSRQPERREVKDGLPGFTVEVITSIVSEGREVRWFHRNEQIQASRTFGTIF